MFGNKVTKGCKTIKYIIAIVVISLLPYHLTVYGQTIKNFSAKKDEVPLPNKLHLKLAANNNPQHLNYPKGVEQIYQQAGKKLLWIAPDNVKTHAADAMMMFDCVLQYGLNHDDYHPKELVYDKLDRYTSKFSKINFAEKLRFDKLLTDAMLTFINDLHYGKLNPDHSRAQIDGKGFRGFNAKSELLKAIHQEDFYAVVDNVQPKSEAYINLQSRMHTLEGKTSAECYSFPEFEIRKMAINMERLRWINKNEPVFIQINIPSFTLKFVTPDSTYEFKVIVGAPNSPTQTRQDALSYFSTKLKGSAGNFIFQLNNLPAMNFRGFADKKVFGEKGRVLSKGLITVEQPDKLAALLLKYDGSKHQIARLNETLVNGKLERFNLSKPISVIITYLTLEINEGIIASYKDMNNQDKDLEMALYNRLLPFKLRTKAIAIY